SLIVLDTDTLKDINDASGHAAGDDVLRSLASILKDQPRNEDIAYRIGGDEFALIVPDTETAGAVALAERLRHRVETQRIGIDRDLILTVSVGIASFPEHATTTDRLFDAADTALYEVKRAGGNAVAIGNQRDSEKAEGVKFGVDIRLLLSEERLVPRYQPIVELRSGKILGYETFCRLDPRFGYLPTQSLLRAAGALDMLEQLDRVCRRVTLRGTSGIDDDELLFVNVSPSALAAVDFRAEEIADNVHEAGLSKDQIVIEVTEEARSASSTALMRGLDACLSEGFKLAMDDFAGSRADLELLTRVAFSYVKIDAGFGQTTTDDDPSARVLSSLAEVAAGAGAVVVAE